MFPHIVVTTILDGVVLGGKKEEFYFRIRSSFLVYKHIRGNKEYYTTNKKGK